MATGKIEKLRKKITGSLAGNSTRTVSLGSGVFLVSTGHGNVVAYCGLYQVTESAVQTIVNASNVGLTMNNGTLTIQNKAGATVNYLIF